ncbi:unnamed protein product [Mycena citricolor]|uniref:Prenylcysteine lyase domain-containing protein n=1 Tax=Mycena citricolor TaxID=2018698 RepID=A0AAD2HQQ7_9AGAR|nr:unnamed protein product [Mycena citricolor]
MRARHFLVLSSLLGPASALQLPFKVPSFFDHQAKVEAKPRIAIIGAGAGGSSAAFWLAKAQALGVEVEVDLFEKESYVGGRTVVYPYDNKSFPAVELGASIFVKANKNMWRAVDEFNLTRRDFKEEQGLGIWDGEKILYTANGGWWGWWDTAKALLRYGIQSPRRTQSFVDGMIKTTRTKSTPWRARVLLPQPERGKHTAVAGGNFLVFEQFLNHSQANVHLNTAVTSIKPKSSGDWVVTSSEGSQSYKAVILAAPFHSTKIDVPVEIASAIPIQPYVHLHVTLVSTTAPRFSPGYFSQSPSAKLPAMMLTTASNARQGGPEPEFNSISYHGRISESEWVVKVFSKTRITDEWLSEMFDGQVGWVYRKEWDAYPELPPTSRFPDVMPAPGFYYVNSFEPFISTMETEVLSARNIVDLLLDQHFESGICGGKLASRTVADDFEDYVYGWDC